MATAEELRAEFTEFLEERGIKFSTFDEEDNIVALSFSGDDELVTTILVDFDEDEDDADSVHISTYRCAKCSQENIPGVLLKLNEANRKFRWVKFWVDTEEGWVTCDTDAQVYPGSVGEECTVLVFRMVDIVDDALDMMDGLLEESDFGEFLAKMAFLKGSLS